MNLKRVNKIKKMAFYGSIASLVILSSTLIITGVGAGLLVPFLLTTLEIGVAIGIGAAVIEKTLDNNLQNHKQKEVLGQMKKEEQNKTIEKINEIETQQQPRSLSTTQNIGLVAIKALTAMIAIGAFLLLASTGIGIIPVLAITASIIIGGVIANFAVRKGMEVYNNRNIHTNQETEINPEPKQQNLQQQRSSEEELDNSKNQVVPQKTQIVLPEKQKEQQVLNPHDKNFNEDSHDKKQFIITEDVLKNALAKMAERKQNISENSENRNNKPQSAEITDILPKEQQKELIEQMKKGQNTIPSNTPKNDIDKNNEKNSNNMQI